jgi:hypothetical protein
MRRIVPPGGAAAQSENPTCGIGKCDLLPTNRPGRLDSGGVGVFASGCRGPEWM